MTEVSIKDNRNHRNGTVDVARALALFLVIVGHAVSSETQIFRFIFGFHMPFFFFASGLFFNPEKFDTFGIFLKKKAKSLLLPYLVFSCLGILIMLVFPSWRILGVGKKWYVLRYVYYTQPPALGQSWFLVCLFVTLLIAYAIYRMKLLRNIWSTLAVIVALAVIGTVAIPRIPVPYFGRLPLKIDSAITAAVFLLLGYVVKQKKDLIRWNLWVRIAGLIVLPVLVYFVSVRWNGYVNICDFEYSNPILYFIAAIAGSVWLIDIGSFLEKSKILCWIGKNSLYLFGIHSFVLWAWIRVYCKIMHVETEYLTNIGWILAVSLVTLASCMAVIAVYLKLASVIKTKYSKGKQ